MKNNLALLACMLLVACSTFDAKEAQQIADNYLKTRSDIDLSRLESEVNDRGSTWVVVYTPPPNFAGGGPVITINKKSGKIVKAVFYQ